MRWESGGSGVVAGGPAVASPTRRGSGAATPRTPPATAVPPPDAATSAAPAPPVPTRYHQARTTPLPPAGPTFVIAVAAEEVFQVVLRPRNVRRAAAGE